MESQAPKQLYIVLSQTGTVLSRLLKKITGAEYNHSSIGIDPDLKTMFSFGRRRPYNPFWAGYVMEAPNTGTFKRFPDTEATVIAVDITQEDYNNICNVLYSMYSEKDKYHYNLYGLFLAWFKIYKKRKHHFYCSEFVRDVFERFEVEGFSELEKIVQPMHFLQLPNSRVVYVGKLNEYSRDMWLEEKEPVLIGR